VLRLVAVALCLPLLTVRAVAVLLCVRIVIGFICLGLLLFLLLLPRGQVIVDLIVILAACEFVDAFEAEFLQQAVRRELDMADERTTSSSYSAMTG
jgi:hypothetical protein